MTCTLPMRPLAWPPRFRWEEDSVGGSRGIAARRGRALGSQCARVREALRVYLPFVFFAMEVDPQSVRSLGLLNHHPAPWLGKRGASPSSDGAPFTFEHALTVP